MIMTFLENGKFQITSTMPSTFLGSLVFEEEQGLPISLDYKGQGVYVAPGIRMTLQFKAISIGMEVALHLDMESERHIAFCGINFGPLQLTAQDRFYGNFTSFLENVDGIRPALAAQTDKQDATLAAMVVRPGKDSCLAGIGACHADASSMYLTEDCFCVGFRPERKMAGRHVFQWIIGCDSDPLKLLQDYGHYIAPLGRGGGPIPTGWNSWDFYGGAISMATIESEIDALNQLACRDHLNYLTIDMGWEEGWGQWTPNRRFPAAFETIAEKIRAGGWQPGIWTAPFQVSMFAPLARERQDIFLHNEEGGLIVEEDSPVGPVLLLDFSLPEVTELLGNQFKLMRQAGFSLFKVDYMYEHYLKQAKYCSNRMGKIAFARQIFQTIRNAVGQDAHIVNCGGPKEAALGLVDSSRATGDIHTFWGHIRNNARQLAKAFWMNRHLWINDPDFAIVRCRDNCKARYLNMPYTPRPAGDGKEFWMRGLEASLEELRLWLSVVRLSGGSVMLSDSMVNLTGQGRAMLERLFPPLTTPFVPLDLFERDYPGIWLSQDQHCPTLGLFNWEDKPCTLELPAAVQGPMTARDFWTRQPVQLLDTVTLGPRSGVLLELDANHS